jgi:hypothetical protein
MYIYTEELFMVVISHRILLRPVILKINLLLGSVIAAVTFLTQHLLRCWAN